jgi:hypothetical protein
MKKPIAILPEGMKIFWCNARRRPGTALAGPEVRRRETVCVDLFYVAVSS